MRTLIPRSPNTHNPAVPVNPAAADGSTPAALSPEEVIQQLRALRAQIPEVTPLTSAQRRLVRLSTTQTAGPVVQASINVIGASDAITQLIGQPAGDVRQMVEEANRWNAAEDEVRAMLNGIAGGNLVRRQKIAFLTSRAYGLGRELARDPENVLLVPHVAEVKRQRKLVTRRKRIAQDPENPSPAPGASLIASTSETPKS
jgi:hypothetical protein